MGKDPKNDLFHSSRQGKKKQTKMLFVALSLACLEISFIGSWCCYATFSFGIQNESYMS